MKIDFHKLQETACFSRFKENVFYYTIFDTTSKKVYEFPIPIYENISLLNVESKARLKLIILGAIETKTIKEYIDT